MKLCCCTVCCAHKKLPEALATISAAGWNEIELVAVPGWCHFEAGKDDVNLLKELLSENGLSVAAIHAGGIKCESPETAVASVSYFEKAIELGKQLGCRRLVFTGSRRDRGGGLHNAIVALKQLEKLLEEQNALVGIENHYRNWFETTDDFSEIFRHIQDPRLGLTIDTGHFTSSKVDMLALIARYGDRVKHVHIKDHIGTESVPIGTGETNNVEVVKALSDLGYDGYLSLELEVKDKENIEQYVAEAREIMEGWLGDP